MHRGKGIAKKLAARLRQYIEERQKDWDMFVQPISYGYSTRVHRTRRASPFTLILSRDPQKALASQITNFDDISQLRPGHAKDKSDESVSTAKRERRQKQPVRLETHTQSTLTDEYVNA